MIQHNQVGKYKRKDAILDAKRGKTFVTPKNKSYVFDYTKRGAKYIYVVIYAGHRMQILESDFTKVSIDDLLDAMEQGIGIQ